MIIWHHDSTKDNIKTLVRLTIEWSFQ